MKKVAVILSGCGYLDGSEIRESVLTLLALEHENTNVEIFSLNKPQHHVMNHIKGAEDNSRNRNILEESARIARGKIKDIITLNADTFDALFIPGGFGVAKNNCTFALAGSNATVDELVSKKILDFKNANKPIGAICIAPALIGLILGELKPKMTVGQESEVSQEIEKLGVVHQPCETTQCIVDEVNKIITTPAYMSDDAKLADVYIGISSLVKKTLALA
ncbi:MAG: isoprenoid biosynthesis glyoxalase ElbB [Thalassotalea sp.]|nr:isoprenoid biosynthesis glyoxalase ElbB [Thalassotalea sp.]